MEFLLRTTEGRRAAAPITDRATDLHVPAVCDVEVASALRGLVRREKLTARRAREALGDYLDLPFRRHGHTGLLPRIFGLRENFSAYDAAYVALAEGLGTGLLTTDRRLRSAVAEGTDVELAEV